MERKKPQALQTIVTLVEGGRKCEAKEVWYEEIWQKLYSEEVHFSARPRHCVHYRPQ